MKVPRFVRTRRASAVSAVAVVAALGLAGWAFAEGELPLLSSSAPDESTTTVAGGQPSGGGDNVAVAVNTKDGKSKFALSLKITQTASDVVDPVNAAVAVASCEDCQTVAIALEAVLVAGEPTEFTPTNIALAINENCTNCQTLAAAYQQVVQNDGRVRISGTGRKTINDIRKDLHDLKNSGLDVATILQRANDAAARLTEVLRTQVFPVGRPADAGQTQASSTTSTAPTPTTSPSTTVPEPTTTTTTTAAPTTTTTVP